MPDEFLLEGGDELEPACLIEGRGGAAQELTRAALPGAAVGVADISQKEVLGRRAVAEIDIHLGGWIGHDHEIAAGAERRIEDRPEAGLHQVGMGPADTGLGPRLQRPRRKALAAHQSGDVAGAYENQPFAQHDGSLLVLGEKKLDRPRQTSPYLRHSAQAEAARFARICWRIGSLVLATNSADRARSSWAWLTNAFSRSSQ
jgi:hypothetical protein